MNENSSAINVAIFASGAGSNAQNIINHFRNHLFINVVLIVCNKPNAGVLKIAEKENISYLLIEKEKFFSGSAYINELENAKIDFIILAGFLWKIPSVLIKKFSGKIINIHPSLLPKYGGKGMYGNFVHEAVVNAGEKETGITIHYVDELYDHGLIIFQEKCVVEKNDNAEDVAKKIHLLEQKNFPRIIEEVIESQNNVKR